MRHFINKSVTIMLLVGTESTYGFTVIQRRFLLIDEEAQLWQKVDSFGADYDVYARLTPEVGYATH